MFEGNPIPVNYNMMPKCIYSQPEIASIGLNIEQAEGRGNGKLKVLSTI